MRKINLEDLINTIEENIKCQKKAYIQICDENGIFTIKVDEEDEKLLSIEETNKYDFLFKKLKENFEGRYDEVSSYDFAGNDEIFMIIEKKVTLFFNYTSKEGLNWLYENS